MNRVSVATCRLIGAPPSHQSTQRPRRVVIELVPGDDVPQDDGALLAYLVERVAAVRVNATFDDDLLARR